MTISVVHIDGMGMIAVANQVDRVVIAAGSLYKVDGRLLPALERLSDGLPVPASELAPEVGEKATRTFIEWGVGNGLLLADVERIERS